MAEEEALKCGMEKQMVGQSPLLRHATRIFRDDH